MAVGVSVPWHEKGTAPAATASFMAWWAGSPSTPSARGQRTTRPPSSVIRSVTAGLAHTGTYTSKARPTARASTAAASAALPQLAMA